MRLAKFLAHSGLASRRAATAIVRSGRVRVDGVRELDPAREIDGERVELDGQVVEGVEPRVVYALHKPAGVVSTVRDTHGRPTVVGLIGDSRRLYPVGRLDADSTGLILLTNDGELAKLSPHPPPRGAQDLSRARGCRTAGPGGTPDAASGRGGSMTGRRRRRGSSWGPADVIELELREGRKRQVRRMCEAVGHPVVALTRVRFGRSCPGRARGGEARLLSDAEVARLRDAARR